MSVAIENLITIIVPCYNQAQYLPEALESVLNQSYQNWECIIVNDGSPDNTEDVAQEWCKKDNRFKYLKKENGGLSSARNAGLNIAKGEFIQFLDSDDLIESDKFIESLLLFDGNPSLSIVVSDFSLVKDYENTKLSPFCILNQNLLNFESILYLWDIDFSIPIHCAIFNKKYISDLSFEENLRAKEDWLMWLKVFNENPQTTFLNKRLAVYRKHCSSMTNNFKFMNENNSKIYKYIIPMLNEENRLRFLLNELSKQFNKSQRLHNQIGLLYKSKSYILGNKIVKFINMFNIFRSNSIK